MKTVWFYPTDNLCLTDCYDNLGPVPVKVSDEGYRLIEKWEQINYREDRITSGVLADWIDDHMTEVPEMRRFVDTLRRCFETGLPWRHQ